MFAALAIVACLADPAYSPTPTYMWDHDGARTEGYRIYWRHADSPGWDGAVTIPVERIPADFYEGVTVPAFDIRRGVDLHLPMQRYVPAAQVEIRFVIKAYSADNVESAPTPIQTLCLPEVWP